MTGICDACGQQSEDLYVINNSNFAGICICPDCRTPAHEPELQIQEIEVETERERNERRIRELEKSFHIPPGEE